jgi:hypothetical protein
MGPQPSSAGARTGRRTCRGGSQTCRSRVQGSRGRLGDRRDLECSPGGRSRPLVLPDDSARRSRLPAANVLLPSLRPSRLGRSTDTRWAPSRFYIEPAPVTVVSPVRAQRAVCETGGAASGAAAMKRSRRALIRDAVVAVAVALALFGAWKLIPMVARVAAVP